MARASQRNDETNPLLRLVPKLAAPTFILPVWQEAAEAYADLVQARMDAEFALYRQRMTMWLRIIGAVNTVVQESDED